MTPASWIPPEWIRGTAWALVHFLWQGTALAALAALLMARVQKASMRYLAAVVVLCLMIAAPVATLLYSARTQSPAIPTESRVQPVVPSVVGHGSAPSPATSSRRGPELLLWLVEAWAVGVACFSLRTLGGLILLRRMGRRQSTALTAKLCASCRDLERRFGISRVIRYCQCAWIEAPAVLGWFRPVILLPVSALTGLSEEQLRAVIAHELAHIKRYDSFVNAFQVVTETLLFYHPAVWWLNRRIRIEREHCCDDLAVAICEDVVEYARALTLMEHWRSVPSLAMAANHGCLSTRVKRLLGADYTRNQGCGLASIVSALSLVASILAANAVLGIGQPARAQSTVPPPPPPAAVVRVKLATHPAKPETSPNPSPTAAPTHSTSALPDKPSMPAAAPIDQSYITQMQAVGLGRLSPDQLLALKIQDVTPEYVRALQAEGVHGDPDVVLAMKIQGVTPEYVRDLRAAGLRPSDDEVIALKIQGITAADARAFQARDLRPTAGELVALRIQGVTPEYVAGLHAQGLKPKPDDVVAMRIQGVTPEYVQALRTVGLNPTVEQVIAFKIQNVSPKYVKALQSLGLRLTADDLLSAKIQGVTPELVESARQHGFKDLTVDKLIELQRIGVLDKRADI